MSRVYKFHNEEGLYFVSFATIGWVDVFTRVPYKTIFVDSLKYCILNKGLRLFSWCLMTNHVHLIIQTSGQFKLFEIMRDLKKFTSKHIIKAIQENPQESRKKWMLSIFKLAGQSNPNNEEFQFWRQNNQPIELWSQQVIHQKLDYIHNNPVKTGIVNYPYEYLYSSAKNYFGEEGLIKVINVDNFNEML